MSATDGSHCFREAGEPQAVTWTFNGITYCEKKVEGQVPQARSFLLGDRKGHKTFARFQIWEKRGDQYLYTSFESNAALIAHLKKHFLKRGRITAAVYEIIRDYSVDRKRFSDFVSRLYFDVEYYIADHKSGPIPADTAAAAEKRLAGILDIITDIIDAQFSPGTKPRFAIACNHRQTKADGYKFSFHITITNIYTHTNLDKRVSQRLIDYLAAHGLDDNGKPGDKKGCVVDPGVNTRNRNMRLPLCAKDRGGAAMEVFVFTDPEVARRFDLAFVAAPVPFETTLSELMVTWTTKEIFEGGAAAGAAPVLVGDFETSFAITQSTLKALRRKVIDATPRGKARSPQALSNPYKGHKGTVECEVIVPEEFDEIAEKLCGFLGRSTSSQVLGWNRSLTLTYSKDDENFVYFFLEFADNPEHMCPSKVMHNGNANKRRPVRVVLGTLEAESMCFLGSKGRACGGWKLLGNISRFRVEPPRDTLAEDIEWMRSVGVQWISCITAPPEGDDEQHAPSPPIEAGGGGVGEAVAPAEPVILVKRKERKGPAKAEKRPRSPSPPPLTPPPRPDPTCSMSDDEC